MTTLKINGESKTFDAPDDMPLLWVLRDHLNLVGTKYGCGIAQCGVCTVHVAGKPVRSCQLAVGDVGRVWGAALGVPAIDDGDDADRQDDDRPDVEREPRAAASLL